VTENRALLQTEAGEFVKQYIAYDSSSRPEYVYVAAAGAADGAPCSITRYTYDGTSSRVLKMKEYEGTWDSSYDI
jgi:hypothetical protein